MGYISFIGIGISLVLTCMLPFYAYKCWRLWKHVNIGGIGAMVTKDRAFLSHNFKLILAVGALNGMHVVFEAVEGLGVLSPAWLRSIFDLLYYVIIIAIMSLLLVLAISWYRLLLKVDRWDRRWIM